MAPPRNGGIWEAPADTPERHVGGCLDDQGQSAWPTEPVRRCLEASRRPGRSMTRPIVEIIEEATSASRAPDHFPGRMRPLEFAVSDSKRLRGMPATGPFERLLLNGVESTSVTTCGVKSAPLIAFRSRSRGDDCDGSGQTGNDPPRVE